METKKAKTTVVVGLLALAGLLLLSLSGQAGNLEPSAPPGPTMKTLDEVEPRIPISSVPYTISAPGSYYLTGDRAVSGSVKAITVNADNVTIDLMGYQLIGPGVGSNHYGVYMDGRSNVEVRNGTVRDFEYGIYEASSGGKGHRVIGVWVASSPTYGIDLHGKGNLVKDCTVVESMWDGIRVGEGRAG